VLVEVVIFLERQHLTLAGPGHLPVTRVVPHLFLLESIQVPLILLYEHFEPTPLLEVLVVSVIFLVRQHLTLAGPGHLPETRVVPQLLLLESIQVPLILLCVHFEPTPLLEVLVEGVELVIFLERQHLTLAGPGHLPVTSVVPQLLLLVSIQVPLILLCVHFEPTPLLEVLVEGVESVIFLVRQHLTLAGPGHLPETSVVPQLLLLVSIQVPLILLCVHFEPTPLLEVLVEGVVSVIFLERQHLTLTGPGHLPVTSVVPQLFLLVSIQVPLILLCVHFEPTPSTEGVVFGIQHLLSLPPGHKPALTVPVQLFGFIQLPPKLVH